MTRRKTKSLTAKEDFINEMIQEAIEHTQGFEVGFISNGEYTFSELLSFIKQNDKFSELDKFVEIERNLNIPFAE